MPEPKQKQHHYDAQVDSQLAGLRLARVQRPATSKAGESQPHTLGEALDDIEPPEPALVSKLIDFIKSI
jgi:hypothetical protein